MRAEGPLPSTTPYHQFRANQPPRPPPLTSWGSPILTVAFERAMHCQFSMAHYCYNNYYYTRLGEIIMWLLLCMHVSNICGYYIAPSTEMKKFLLILMCASCWTIVNFCSTYFLIRMKVIAPIWVNWNWLIKQRESGRIKLIII